MKSITLKTTIIATCIAFSQFALAQDATPSPTPKDSAGKTCPAGGSKERGRKHERGEMMGRLAEKLGLTDTQKTQLKEVFQAHKAQMKAIKEDQTLTREAKFEKMKGVMAEIKTQASSFLTPEQIQKWDAMKQGWKEHHHGPKGAQGAPATE